VRPKVQVLANETIRLDVPPSIMTAIPIPAARTAARSPATSRCQAQTLPGNPLWTVAVVATIPARGRKAAKAVMPLWW
jgi:hypothetical protein